MSAETQKSFAERTVFRSAVWALVGLIFGSVFVLVAEMLRDLLQPPMFLLAAAVGASAVTALAYGSMRLTVMTANFTFIAMLAFTWQGPDTLTIQPLVFAGALVGAIVGLGYGWFDKHSRVFCAEAKVVAGIVAGFCAGLLALAIGLVTGDLGTIWSVLVIGPVGTLVYVTTARWFVLHCHHWLPATFNGLVVGLGVGAVTGLLFTVMAGSLSPEILQGPGLTTYVERVGETWLPSALGCAAVCAVVGFLRSLLNVPWYDL